MDERDHFVAPVIGLHELRILFVQLEQRLLKRGELEEVILFGNGFGRGAACRARIAGLDVVDVGFIADAISPGIRTLIDVAVLLAALEQPAHGLVMLGVRGADEMVVIDAELGPLADELGRHLRCVRQRVHARGLRGALHFQAVLVGAGGEHHRIVAFHFLEALDQVRDERGVGGAQMRRRVDVIDGSGEVIFHREFFR